MTSVLKERDVLLAAAATVAAAAALAVAIGGPAPVASAGETPVVASVKLASAELRVRPAQTLGWQVLVRGQVVRDADSVFVPPGAEAQLLFSDGTVLELDERSLVVVEPPRGDTRTVTLRQGALSGRAGTTGLTVATDAGQATLASGAEARVQLDQGRVEVDVTKGQARLTTGADQRQLSAGARARGAGTGVEALPSFSVALGEPAANFRRLFRGATVALVLTWKDAVPSGARVQVAHDRLFAFVEVDEPAVAGALRIDAPTPGVSWWRVVNARGEPLSEARRYTLVEDLAPGPLVPHEGEVVPAPPGTQVPFSWTPLPGITRYRVEVSSSKGFEPVQVTQEAAGSQVRVPLGLSEGSWYWRVRAADEDLGEGGPSAPVRFRLIHKAIPDAPELFNPEIEVVPE